jgi:hypothetical protein
MASTNTTRCAACKREAKSGETFQRCSGCKKSNYCSADCQRNDWRKGHKQQCKIISLTEIAQTTATTYNGESVKGVRLACEMEPGLINETDIPIDHTIFDNPLLEVPAIMGIPLVIHRLGTKSNNRADLDCLVATFLNVTYRDGFAPPEWQSHVGSCLVARKDKKPLSVEQLEAVWLYIDRLMDMFGDGPKSAQKNMNRDDFESWFEEYKEESVGYGQDQWKDVGSLYDI